MSLYSAALHGVTVAGMTGPVVVLGHDPLTGAANGGVAVNLSNTGARLITPSQLRFTMRPKELADLPTPRTIGRVIELHHWIAALPSLVSNLL